MQRPLAVLLLGALVCGACGGIATTSGEDTLGGPGPGESGTGDESHAPNGATGATAGVPATGGVFNGSGGSAPTGSGASFPGGPGDEPDITACGVTTQPTYDMPVDVSGRWLEIVQLPLSYGSLPAQGVVDLPSALRVDLLEFVAGVGNISGTAFSVDAPSSVLRVQPSFTPGYVDTSERRLAKGYVKISTVRAAVIDRDTHEFLKELQFVRCDG